MKRSLKKRKNILILTSTFPRWEGDTTPGFVRKLAEETMKDAMLNVTVIAPHAAGALRREVLASGIKVIRLKYALFVRNQNVFYSGGAINKEKSFRFLYGSALYSFRLFFSTLRLAFVSDVIHAHWLVPQGLVAVIVGKVLRKKSIVTVHGGDIFTMNSFIGRALKKTVLMLADEVCIISSETELACRKLHNRRYTFGPMGTDFYADPYNKYKKQGHLVFFAGRIAEEKGLRYLIDAMSLLDETYMLEIAGDGPLMQDMKLKTKKLGLNKRINFLGWIDNSKLRSKLSRANVFVGPSITLENGWREGMGIVYLEALSCGVPVVTTEHTGAKDFIKSKTNGIIVKEKNAKEIANAIIFLSEQTEAFRKEFNKFNKEIYIKYSWIECAKRYKRLYYEA